MSDALVEALSVIELAKAEHGTNQRAGTPEAFDALDYILTNVDPEAVWQVRADALRRAAEVMLDPKRGLPLDDEHVLAVVSAWVLEYAEDVENGEP